MEGWLGSNAPGTTPLPPPSLQLSIAVTGVTKKRGNGDHKDQERGDSPRPAAAAGSEEEEEVVGGERGSDPESGGLSGYLLETTKGKLKWQES